MILVRDEFRLKFGRERDAQSEFKDIAAKAGSSRANGARSMRILSDQIGTYYTMVIESIYDDLASYERFSTARTDPEWRAAYQKFVPLVDSGYREIFTIEEAV